MRWATRMVSQGPGALGRCSCRVAAGSRPAAALQVLQVCGYCSLEQALGPLCKSCGKKLATSAGGERRLHGHPTSCRGATCSFQLHHSRPLLTLCILAATPSGRHTKFWEGGKGQRDPRRLHKGDPRRYRGKGKTSSRKSTRVGDKGKERREQREGAG